MLLMTENPSERDIEKAGDGVYNFYLCSDPGSMAFTWDRSNLNEEGR
jgi:hypothetical protein